MDDINVEQCRVAQQYQQFPTAWEQPTVKIEKNRAK
jgi:hypothetical protein